MAFTHTITYKIVEGSNQIEKSIAISAGQKVSISEAITDGTTDGEVALAIDQSQLKSLYIVADQALVLETNDGAAPDDTITLVANSPVVWQYGTGLTCPITVDITTNLFVTNASGSTATLQCEFLIDPTA